MESKTPRRLPLGSLQSSDELGLLDSIDKLRSQGISHYVNLPQLVVCGDQSSGKSSVLEAISGIPFPTKDNLCTRFATEVILRLFIYVKGFAKSFSVVTTTTMALCGGRRPQGRFWNFGGGFWWPLEDGAQGRGYWIGEHPEYKVNFFSVALIVLEFCENSIECLERICAWARPKPREVIQFCTIIIKETTYVRLN